MVQGTASAITATIYIAVVNEAPANLQYPIRFKDQPLVYPKYVNGVYQYIINKAEGAGLLYPTNAGGALTKCVVYPNLHTYTGLTFSPVNCEITGTPTVLLIQPMQFTVKASNAGNPSTSTTITIQVLDA